MDWKSSLVLYLIVSGRLLLPFTIPRYPLAGILSCLLLDSADQSIFQAFGVYLTGYQGYDKALDLYYLAVAYLSTLRNWENVAALQVGRVLFYLRLTGVLSFELSNVRLLLAVFSNAFEPFFIFNEMTRRRGRHLRLTRAFLIVSAAVIWVGVKLPHEWWVHVARLDATDFVKTKILGARLETPFWRAVVEAPVVTGTLTVLAALVALAGWRLRGRLKHLLERVTTSLFPGSPRRAPSSPPRRVCAPLRPFALGEKIVLVSAICVVFQQTLPGLAANGVQTAFFVAVAIILADFLLRWVGKHLGSRSSKRADSAQTALLNFSFVLLFQLFLPVLPPKHNLGPALVFAALITLYVTLYDLYRPVYENRQVSDHPSGV